MRRAGEVGRLAGFGLVLIAAASCGGGEHARATPAATPVAVQTAVVPPAASGIGGCGNTPIHRGPAPALVPSPPPLPYAVSRPPDVVAVLFAYPLRAGHPENPRNEILWAVGAPRNGSPLVIEGRFLGGGPTVRLDQEPANSGPGEIYPSIVDVPYPGCWELTLRWAGHRAVIDLPYR